MQDICIVSLYNIYCGTLAERLLIEVFLQNHCKVHFWPSPFMFEKITPAGAWGLMFGLLTPTRPKRRPSKKLQNDQISFLLFCTSSMREVARVSADPLRARGCRVCGNRPEGSWPSSHPALSAFARCRGLGSRAKRNKQLVKDRERPVVKD